MTADRDIERTFALGACDVVPTGGQDAMLRVSGRWTPSAPPVVDLFVPAGGGRLITALPPGPTVSDAGVWSVAYALEPAAAQARLALVPETGGAIPFTLAASGGGASRRVEQERSGRLEAEQRLARALEDLADAESLADQFRRRCELSERGLTEFREKLVQAWAEAGELRNALDSREAAHAMAKRREREAADVLEQLESRALQAEAELTARRAEIEDQCTRLADELSRRSNAEERAGSLRAEADEALARFEAARQDAEMLQSQLAEARSVAEETSSDVERLARELSDEQARTEEAAHLADMYSERLAKAERELAEAQDKLVEARSRADARAAEAERMEVELRRQREATAESDRQLALARDRLAAAQLEIATGRERLSALQKDASALSSREQAARQELATLTRTDLGEGGRRGRSKVSARAYRELAAKLEHEQSERTRLEDETARLADRLREMEHAAAQVEQAPAPDPSQATVEADLRHLLSGTQQELEDARRELREQRARYVAIASELPAAEVAPMSAVATRPDEPPWTAVDDDLLGRIARAKEFAGQD